MRRRSTGDLGAGRAMTVALLGCVVLAVGVLTGHQPSVRAADDVALVLVDQPFVLAPDTPWTAAFRVIGDLGTATPTTTTTTLPGAIPGEPAVPAPTVEAHIVAHRVVTDTIVLAETFAGDPPPDVDEITVPASLTVVSGQNTLNVTVPTTSDDDDDDDDTPALELSRPGLYPITVELAVDGDVVATHHTFVERLTSTPATGVEPMQVAVLAAATDPGLAPTADQLATAHDELSAIASTAAALDGAITVQLPPVLLADLETTDQALLQSLREALETAEVLAVPSPALDPSSARAAGLDDAFSANLRAGEDLLGTALPGDHAQRSAWVVDSPISTSGAAMLRDPLGYDLLVFRREIYDGLTGGIGGYHDPTLSFGVNLGDRGELPGFVPHPASRWLDRTELTAQGIASTDGAVAIMAELIVGRRSFGDDTERSAVLTTPPGVVPDPEVAATLARYVAAVPDFTLARLADLPTRTGRMDVPELGPELVALPATAGPDLTARANRINLTRYGAAATASMLPDRRQRDAWNAELDALLTTQIDDATADAAIDRIVTEVEAVREPIEMPQPDAFTLTGRSSSLRVNIRNTSSQVLRVVVRASSPKFTFPDGDVTVELIPNDVTEVVIPVEAVSNGTSAIGIEALTPDGLQRIGGPVILTAHVNALSGLGQVVTGGALLVLVSWWYGHFRRNRRKRRAMLGEVDNPLVNEPDELSPDAAEATARTPGASDNLADP